MLGGASAIGHPMGFAQESPQSFLGADPHSAATSSTSAGHATSTAAPASVSHAAPAAAVSPHLESLFASHPSSSTTDNSPTLFGQESVQSFVQGR